MVDIAGQVARSGVGRQAKKAAPGAKPPAADRMSLPQRGLSLPGGPGAAPTGTEKPGEVVIRALRRWRLIVSGFIAIALVVLLAVTVGSIAATLSGMASALDAAMARRALVAEVESALRAEIAASGSADAVAAAAYRERATNASRTLSRVHDRLIKEAGAKASLFYAAPLRADGALQALPGAQVFLTGPGEPAGQAIARALVDIDRIVTSVGRLAAGNPTLDRLLLRLPVLAQAFEEATRAHIDDAYASLYRRVYVQLGLVLVVMLGLAVEHVMVFRPMIGRFESALGEVEAARDRMAMAARIDGLTGLWNRSVLREVLDRECKRAMRQGAVSLLALDIDFFKKVNDTHGHPAGDEVLKSVAQVMAAAVRDVDAACRFGGEEFFIVLPDTGLQGAQIVAERIRKAVMAKVVPLKSGESVRVTVSIGIATYPGKGEQRPSFGAGARQAVQVATIVERLFNDADQLLYDAKHGGRNRVMPALPAAPAAATPHEPEAPVSESARAKA